MTAKPTYAELEQKIESLEKAAQGGWIMTAVNAAGDAIGLATADGHHFYQNKSFDQMFGYTIEEFSRLRPRIIYGDENLADKILKRVMAGRSWHGEIEMVAKNGRRFPVLLRADAVRDESGDITGLISVHTDITERKQAVEALRESEQKFKMMSEQSLLAIGIIQGGLFKYANQAYCDISGYSIDDIMRWKPYEYAKVVHPDDRAFVMEQSRKKQTGASDAAIHYQFKGITKKGETKWLELYSKTVLYRKRSAALAMFIDITEHKRAEQALQESEGRFRRFSAATFEGLIVHEDGVVISANDQYYEMFGYEPGELTGKQALPLTVAPEALDTIKKKITAGDLGPYEIIGIKKDGTKFPVEIRVREWEYEGREVRVAVIMDITERKLAEEKLQHFNQRLMILRQIDQDIILARSTRDIVDTVLQHIRQLVSCWRASVIFYEPDTNEIVVFGSKGEGATLMQPGMRLPAGDGWISPLLTKHRTIVKDTHTLPEPISPAAQLVIKSGIRSFISVSLLAEGNLIGALSLSSKTISAFSDEDLEIAREVADQLAIAIHQARMKEQIERHAAELEEKVTQRTDELKAINEELQAFTYSVSHDLKAPLRGIDGYSRLLLQDYADKLDGEGQTFLHTIRGATQQMSRLIDDLLAYSRLERRAMRTGELDPRSLVEMVITDRADELRKQGVTLDVDIPCTTVKAEAEGLTEALRNLLENALKFSRDVPDPRIEIGGRETDKSCILWVRDNGIGFDMRYHERIFEIFQRLHRAEDFPGTGVGLAIVRKVVQRMGGRVWAESKPGHGATFYLEVPK